MRLYDEKKPKMLYNQHMHTSLIQ